MSFSPEERQRLVIAGAQALQARALGRARQMLLASLQAEDEIPADEVTFLALRLLGQLTRELGDLPTATSIYRDARKVAVHLGRSDLESAALEGLAIVARADDNHDEAVQLYDLAAQRALEAGDAAGYAAVLANKGDALTALRRFREAEDALRAALSSPSLDAAHRAIVEDNLGLALAGAGRYPEALEVALQAAAAFDSAGMQRDLAKALSNIEAHQRALGQTEEATATFVRRFELTRSIAVAGIDPEHYAQYGERVRQIEEETSRRLGAQAQEDPADPEAAVGGWLEIGINALLGEQLGNEGDRRFEAGDYRAAEQSYLQALAHWEHLGAVHALPRVNFSLGMLYTEVGQPGRALDHLVVARQQAHAVGDAFRESAACTNLCRLLLDSSQQIAELDEVELLAHARALEPLAVRQLIGREVETEQIAEGAGTDGGVIDALETTIFMRHGAIGLAERAVRRSLATIEEGLEGEGNELFRYRLALRLVKLYSLLRQQKKDAEADTIEERLRQLSRLDGHPRIARAINSQLGLEQFERDEWTEAALMRLVSACDAYEQMRGSALAVGTPADRRDLRQPPFDEAIEVALHLGQAEAAFGLLERSKARTLLESIQTRAVPDVTDPALVEEAHLWHELQEARAEFDRVLPEDSASARAQRLHQAQKRAAELEPQLEEMWGSLTDAHPGLVAHRLARPATAGQVATALGERADNAVVVELFVGPRSVQAFTVSATGGLAVHKFVDAADPGWRELAESMEHFEGKLVSDVAMAALAHATVRSLSTFVQQLAGDAPVFLVPHRFLHSVPLHLTVGAAGALVGRPQTFYLPSASLIRYASKYVQNATGVVIGGDPRGDLPFARLEATATARRFSATAATGSTCNAQWLAEHLADGHPPLRLLHLACHAVFHPLRGERSGIVLAEDNRARVLNVAELATFDWSSTLTVLSACSTGQSQVGDGDELTGMTRTLLARGAAAIIVALWEVPDLPTYLLVAELYDRLAPAKWTLEQIAAALTDAQTAVRDMTARDLVNRAIALRATSVDDQDAVTERCALAAVATAHRAAANHEESLIWREAAQHAASGETPPHDRTPNWVTLSEVAAAPEYSAAPFADPRNWAAFVLLGCG